ncbi:hypothetical protein RclHR1_02390001 [Rhizophagus clarus]|uniref:tRNA-splicing endonuclease n=1 Tax=Rhizophagus clarus TaxID=94130 RepID=A0A2Z6QYD5_9GLOM|nr:hypothetical protein RclHR1_02390001 [Rhizophagus clarus]GES97837.1 tRNA-splicing endonuclease [Rhizophagus clarus]
MGSNSTATLSANEFLYSTSLTSSSSSLNEEYTQVTHDEILLLLRLRKESTDKQSAEEFFNKALAYLLSLHHNNPAECHWFCNNELNDISTEMLHLFGLQDPDEYVNEFKSILKEMLTKCLKCVKNYIINKRNLYERHKIHYDDKESINFLFSLIQSWDEQRVLESLYFLKYQLNLNKEIFNDDWVTIFEILFNISLFQNHDINTMFSEMISKLSQNFFQTLTDEFPPGLFLASVHESEDVRKIAWKCLQITLKGSNLKIGQNHEYYQLFKKLLDYYLYNNNWRKLTFEYPIVKKEVFYLTGITKIICVLDFEKLHDILDEDEDFDMSNLFIEKFTINKSESTFVEIVRFLRALICKLKHHFWFNSKESSPIMLLRSITDITDNQIFYNVMESTKSEATKKVVFDLFPAIIDSLRDYNEEEYEIFINVMLENLLCIFQKSDRNEDFSLKSLKMALKIIEDHNYSFHSKLYYKFQDAINDRLGIYHKNLSGSEREKIINEILKYGVEVFQDENDDQFSGSESNPIMVESVSKKISLENPSHETSLNTQTTNTQTITPKNSSELTTTETTKISKEPSENQQKNTSLKLMPKKPVSWNQSKASNSRKDQSIISKMRESFLKEQKAKFEMHKRIREENEKYAKIDEERRKLREIDSETSRKTLSRSVTPQAVSLSSSTSDNESAESFNSRKSKRIKIDNGINLNNSNSKLRKYIPPQKPRKTKLLDMSEVIRNQESSYQQRAVANKRRKDNIEKRLKPNINNLFKQVLSWGLKSKGDLPPNTLRDQYHQIPNTFENVEQYIKIFEPLLILECWQSFMQSKEDLDMDNDKYDTLIIEGMASIDDFQELSCRMNLERMRNIADSDLVVVVKNIPNKNSSKMFLAIVKSCTNHEHVTLLCYLQNDDMNIRSELRPETSWMVYRIMSLTPPKREYAALVGLPYFQYKDMILNPKGQIYSPIPKNDLVDYMTNFHINQSQAEAVHKVIQQKNGFSLIQGPPGTGKTSTILAIISSLRGVSSQYKHRILACAPSNAAVDELERRLRQGIYNSCGDIVHLNVVRFGKLDSSDKDPNSPEGEQKLKIDRLEKKLKVLNKRRQEARSGWDLSTIEAEIDQTKDEIGKAHEILRNLKAEQQSINYLTKRGNISNADLFEADVVCATLAGSGHETFANIGIQFSTVIIDEAAQAIELNTLIPLKYDASRIVLVGDPNQLPPTVLSQIATDYSYEQSLFVRFQRCFPGSIHLLDTQYRMHPEISRFPSRLFYNNALLDAPELERKKSQVWHNMHIFGPYRFFDVEGKMIKDKKKSSYNTDEAYIAVKLFLTLIKKFQVVDFKDKVGIITPYKRQLIELRAKFKQKVPESYYNKIEFNTVDGFQGREKDIIIFSCVRVGEDKGIGFLKDIRRMNVALTRAKCSLFILGNRAALESNSQWKELIKDAIQRGFYTDCSDLAFERGLL